MKSPPKYDDFWLATRGETDIKKIWQGLISDVTLNNDIWCNNSICELIRRYHKKWYKLRFMVPQ
jgi:hypothetical protein